jgi:hypothetical protein
MKTMQKLAVIVVLGIVMFSAALVGGASAQQAPTVVNQTPFSVGTNYMSKAGYHRYLYHQQTNVWSQI